MADYLIDTCIISELTRPRPDPAVEQWIWRQPQWILSAVTLEELMYGVHAVRDENYRRTLDGWLRNEICGNAIVTFLRVDDAISAEAGRMRGQAKRQGKTATQADALIAATARVEKRTVVTANVDDFLALNVPVFNPFSTGGRSPRKKPPGERR
jgi:predicted nucleic acid-binding protein